MAAALFRQTLEEMVDPKHPSVILSCRIPWKSLEEKVALLLVPERRSASAVEVEDLFGTSIQMVAANRGGRPSLPTRLLMSLLYLKHAFNPSDEELCDRWADRCPGSSSADRLFTSHVPCDPTQIGRFRKALGEEGVEYLLMATIETAVASKAVKPPELERLIVDRTIMVRHEVATVIVSPLFQGMRPAVPSAVAYPCMRHW